MEGSIDPVRDIEIIDTELCLADLETVDNRLNKVAKLVKAHDKKAIAEEELLHRVHEGLENIVPARRMEFTEDEEAMLYDLHLLTKKPIIFVCNVPESEAADASANPYVKAVQEFAAKEHAEVVPISAKVEADIAELPDDEAKEFLEMEGMTESGLNRLIKAGFKLLGLQTYLTAGEIESRAWTINIGTKAPQAAGKIHSDFEKGFIKAEIVSYDDLVQCGSKQAAREKAWSASKARTMSCRTATSSNSVSTCNKQSGRKAAFLFLLFCFLKEHRLKERLCLTRICTANFPRTAK